MDKKTTILAYCFNLLIGLPHFGRGKREGEGEQQLKLTYEAMI